MAFPLLLLAMMVVTSRVLAADSSGTRSDFKWTLGVYTRSGNEVFLIASGGRGMRLCWFCRSKRGEDYIYRKRCDGNSYGRTRYCYIDLHDIGKDDLNYYDLDLITDYSTSRAKCRKGYYALEVYRDYPAIRVYRECHGYFGIKPKVAGFPYKETCGQDNYGGFKIINGYAAKVCQFPWMAYVYLAWKSGHYIQCGGSIVSDRWILTAAHCIIKQHGNGAVPPPSAVIVRTGSLDKNANYIKRDLDWIVKHPKYETKHLRYDIALLRLRRAIKWDGCHAPVCLNSNKNVADSSDLTCIISGWGRSSFNSNNHTSKLLWAYDRILPRKECDKIYRGYSTDNTLCGRATVNEKSGFCSGDSGGPLVCKSKRDGKYYQHGVVSLYYSARACKMEGLYGSVAGVYDWITRYVR